MTVRFWLGFFAVWGTVLYLAGAAITLAQGPAAPQPSCDEQLNNEMFQRGGVTQQLAVARAQLQAMTKERDDAKAALAKVTPKTEPAKTPEKK